MENSKPKIKVKDIGFTMFIIYAFGIFPIVFLATLNVLDSNFLITSVVLITVFTVLGILYFRKLIRDENVFVIIADEESITILKYGTYKWNEILKMETYTKLPYGSRNNRMYIKFFLSNGLEIVLDATSYDIFHKDLLYELNKLRGDRH